QYDYIVVGGGNAGLVIANRLTENPKISVLVLEAGLDYSDDFNITVPGLDLTVTGGSMVDWNYTTAPQVNMQNRQIAYPRGYVLGGSSSTNFMAYTRGSAAPFDKWAEIGNAGWDWEGVYPYFKKSCHFTPPLANQSFIAYDQSAYDYPGGGPLQVTYGHYIEPASIYFSEALANTSGLNLQEKESNDGSPIGQSYLATTVNPKNENRDSSWTSFGLQAASRPNFHYLTHALATRLLFNPTAASSAPLVVSGVEYRDKTGATKVVYANKEVVLAAGAFGSPQLLMVSGIGPADQLAANNIPLRVSLPGVGQNMTDHLFFGPVYEVISNITSAVQFLNNATKYADYLNQWETYGEGEFAGAISSMSTWERLPDEFLESIGAQELIDLREDWNHVQLEIIASGAVPGKTGNFVTPGAVISYPFSRGNLSIISNSTTVKPIVQPNWLQSSIDQQVAIYAFKQVREAMLSQTMAPIVITEAYPGLNATSDADILAAIQATGHPIYQASGTCAMKPRGDGGVVDAKLVVYGTKNLRVADASIFPVISSANTMAPVYMVAEKAADLIK
ncbi:aryl-alcohol oxidase, partial [Jaapia argillacea MUCL 33604]